ncbi:zinc metalloprotease HtpX [Phycisphaerales bacterium AB-hyl4]|uniref:Protease HtpX homolog n=1 Tax=Natronomicrosphaera hydrolytica TaxID=3242702 RepID=A0ABV4U5H7_9BACT
MNNFANWTKTAFLLGLMFGLILLAGYIIGEATGMGAVQGLTIGLLLGGVMNFIAYFHSDKIAIKAMRGQAVDAKSAPDLVNMVERLARNANLPMPRVYICPQQAPNAFATGRNPKNAAVAVTNGALRLLSYEELEGVMAHELAHVKNRDTLISTVAATIAGAISYLGWIFLFSGGGGRNVHPLLMLVLFILAPISAALIQMAISRNREYGADAEGARIAGTPAGLISALQKLEATNRRVPMENEMPAQNHMFIVQPLSAGQAFSRMFSTHPPTEARVAALQKLEGLI